MEAATLALHARPTTDDLRALIEREKAASLWGQAHRITPLLVDEVFGDGSQLIWLSPTMTRPNYYVIRVDSAWELNSDLREHLGEIYEAIECQFGYEVEDEVERGWPALSSGGSSWGPLEWPASGQR